MHKARLWLSTPARWRIGEANHPHEAFSLPNDTLAVAQATITTRGRHLAATRTLGRRQAGTMVKEKLATFFSPVSGYRPGRASGREFVRRTVVNGEDRLAAVGKVAGLGG